MTADGPLARSHRPEPRPGDYGLTAGHGRAMWLVRLGTFSRYGHAAICVGVEQAPTGEVRPIIVEASGDGARQRVVTDPGEFVWSARRIGLTGAQRTGIVEEAKACIGIPYDYWAILCFIGRVWKSRLFKTDPARPGDDKLICSELVVWAYREGPGRTDAPGMDLAPGKSPGDVSPGDLDEVLDRGTWQLYTPQTGTTGQPPG